MDKLTNIVVALGPAFAAGFAIQQLMEILDWGIAFLARVLGRKKRTIALILSAGFGFAVAEGAGLHIMQTLADSEKKYFFDPLVSALVIGAGTEGFNSILKLLGYKKDAQKEPAADSQVGAQRSAPPNASAADLMLPAPQVMP
jgi:hypothetical protein